MFPYRYRNETTGEWQGMLVDLLAAVCDAAYLDCEVVEFGKLDQRIPLLASGGADFLLDILVRARARVAGRARRGGAAAPAAAPGQAGRPARRARNRRKEPPLVPRPSPALLPLPLPPAAGRRA